MYQYVVREKKEEEEKYGEESDHGYGDEEGDEDPGLKTTDTNLNIRIELLNIIAL